MNEKFKVLCVGLGEMGKAIIDSFIKNDRLINSYGVNPSNVEKYDNCENFKVVNSYEDIDKKFVPDFVIFAVKPNILKDVCKNYRKYVNQRTFFISVAAGIKIKNINASLGEDAKVIRIMPNVGCKVNFGTIGAYANNINKKEKLNVKNLFLDKGYFGWVEEENDLNKITAISGSGIAYVYEFINSMLGAAKKLGFNENDALPYILSTIVGGVKTLEKNKIINVEKLISNVITKGGTTEAAMNIISGEKKPVYNAISKGMIEAYNRSKEISDEEERN